MTSNGSGGKAPMVHLSVMMFLQFFIWGAWYVTVGNYMGSKQMSLELSIGWIYTVGPIAALVSPFFLGMIADRFFSTERVLACLHLLGGITLFAAPYMAGWSAQMWQERTAEWVAQGLDPVEEGKKLWIITEHLPFIGIILLHMLCYMPTLALTNSLAFHHIQNQEKQFPVIRVFGTIGWIVANFVVSDWLAADQKALPLQIAGSGAIALGVYSFFLPHTPPPAAGKKATMREMLGLDALALMKEPAFAVFIIASMLICIPLAAYYAFAPRFVDHAGFYAPAGTMKIGQMTEIIFMLLMPLLFVRLGVKWMLLIGMAAWVLRYGLFALGAPAGVTWMILGGILLHGICFDFFFVTGFIYTDKKVSKEIRGQAQGLLVLVTQGIGLGVGALLMQRIVTYFKSGDYDDLTASADELRRQSAQLTKSADELRQQLDQLTDNAASVAGEQVASLTAQAESLWQQSNELLLQSYDWQSIWLIPCAMAGVIMVFFFLLFKNSGNDASAAAPPME